MSRISPERFISGGSFVGSAEAHQAVLDAVLDAIVVFDRDGRVRMANRHAEELLGVPRGGLVGRHFMNRGYVARDEAGEALEHDDRPVAIALRTGKPVNGVIVETQRLDGTPLWVSISATPIFAAGAEEPHAVAASMVDISRYKNAERELARSNSDLSQFAAVVAHDLSAPLTVIAGMADLVLRRSGEDVDERSAAMLARIAAAARSGQALIRELLEFAQSGRGELRTQDVDVAELTARTIELLDAPGAAARIVTGPLPTVLADPLQLGQVLQNLLSNGLKFSDGPVRLDAVRELERWRITVADDGIGVAPEEREQIFNMLARTPDAEGYPGTGIGLAVCRRIVERHGGRIWVESEPGQGSTFVVTLPAPAAEVPGI